MIKILMIRLTSLYILHNFLRLIWTCQTGIMSFGSRISAMTHRLVLWIKDLHVPIYDYNMKLQYLLQQCVWWVVLWSLKWGERGKYVTLISAIGLLGSDLFLVLLNGWLGFRLESIYRMYSAIYHSSYFIHFLHMSWGHHLPYASLID